MPEYTAPGVSVEETSPRRPSIAGGSTSTAGFVGRTEHIRNAKLDNDAMLDKPVLVQSWTEFVETFGRYSKRRAPYLPPAVQGFFENGGRRCYVVRVPDGAEDEHYIGADMTGLQALCTVDDISIVCIPGVTSLSVQQAMISHCENMRDRVCILDSEKNADVQAVLTQRNSLHSSYGHGALYYPWIRVMMESGKKTRLHRVHDFVPPCGHIAGIYAQTDSGRGVHQAPANVVVSGALDVKVHVTKNEQEILNPKGINCIRTFPGRGILVWGARTLCEGPEWKYVNVRRLLLYLEESIKNGTEWTVFKPNGEALWADVRRTVEDFLMGVWRNGMLQGAKPEEAFFVKCDRTTMTQNDLDNGRLVCLIGVAPLRPAEFVIFRISQWTSGVIKAPL